MEQTSEISVQKSVTDLVRSLAPNICPRKRAVALVYEQLLCNEHFQDEDHWELEGEGKTRRC